MRLFEILNRAYALIQQCDACSDDALRRRCVVAFQTQIHAARELSNHPEYHLLTAALRSTGPNKPDPAGVVFQRTCEFVCGLEHNEQRALVSLTNFTELAQQAFRTRRVISCSRPIRSSLNFVAKAEHHLKRGDQLILAGTAAIMGDSDMLEVIAAERPSATFWGRIGTRDYITKLLAINTLPMYSREWLIWALMYPSDPTRPCPQPRYSTPAAARSIVPAPAAPPIVPAPAARPIVPAPAALPINFATTTAPPVNFATAATPSAAPPSSANTTVAPPSPAAAPPNPAAALPNPAAALPSTSATPTSTSAAPTSTSAASISATAALSRQSSAASFNPAAPSNAAAVFASSEHSSPNPPFSAFAAAAACAATTPALPHKRAKATEPERLTGTRPRVDDASTDASTDALFDINHEIAPSTPPSPQYFSPETIEALTPWSLADCTTSADCDGTSATSTAAKVFTANPDWWDEDSAALF